MANNQTGNDNDNNQTLAERATKLFQDGIESVKNNPGTAAAVLGSVAAAAAAYANRDKLVETASGLREKVSGSTKQESEKA
jgi:hypothetical protein